MRSVEHVRRRHPFETAAYVILPDHLHILWHLPEGDDRFSMRLRLIKEHFTRAHRKRTQSSQSIWQHRFWEHVIRDERGFAHHLDYIHLNPVHHGLAAAPADWPHSSFRSWVERGIYGERWGADEMPALPKWALRHE
jgi:putative transposase